MWQQSDVENEKVIIIIEDKKYVCNRTKLSNYSPYFDAMFHGNFIEKEEKSITLQEVNINGFLNILKFIDNHETFIEYEYVIDTLECACMLQFEAIKQICVKRLVYELRIDNCLHIWRNCELLDIHPLLEQAKCKSFIEFNVVKDTDYFLQLEPKHLHSYLASNLIYCNNEMEIFEAGMKWWYEYSNNLQTNEPLTEEEATKYIFLILNCIDFKSLNTKDINHMLTFPDIASNTKLNCILNEIRSLLSISTQTKNTEFNFDDDIKVCQETKQIFSNSRREKKLLNCILTSELSWQPGQNAKVNKRIMNISYYDEKNKCLKKLFDDNTQFNYHCSHSLKGSKILPYKGNLLLFGGEENYGKSKWNNNVWIYHTHSDKWELLTKMPKERRHFSSCIVDDKLFIIGGTGRFRIKLNDDMFYFDLKTNEWTTNLHLPRDLYERNICIYKNKLLFLRRHDMRAYLFNAEKKSWTELSSHLTSDQKNNPYPETCILFCKDDSVYLKGLDQNKLYEFEINGYNVIEKDVATVNTIHADKFNYYLNNNDLYVFTKIAYVDDIYVLDCFNIKTKMNKQLIQINDSSDEQWHINRGCFLFFHYSVAKNNTCISQFIL